MAKIRLTNLVIDGDFEANGWTGSQIISGGYDNSVKCASMAVGTTERSFYQTIEAPIAGHQYYGCVMAKCTNGVVTDSDDGTFGLFANSDINASGTIVEFKNIKYTAWKRYSNIVSLIEVAGGTWNLKFKATTTSDEIQFDNVMWIDLTSSFGKGKEPTKEWCDTHISYFSGEASITENGYIMTNLVQDPLFLYHQNVTDLYTITATGTTVEGLPAGYKSVGYIQSNGAQSIDLGYKPNNNSGVLIDFEIPSADTNTFAILGARDAQDGAINAYGLWKMDGTTFRFDYGNGNKSREFSTTQGRFLAHLNKNTCMINELPIIATETTFNCASNLTLFGFNTGGTVDTRRISAKLYSCRIYNDGIVVRNLIPCLNADNVAGLYDLANGVFYTAEGLTAPSDSGEEVTATATIEKINGSPPPRSSCLESQGAANLSLVSFKSNEKLPIIMGHKYYVSMDVMSFKTGLDYNAYWPITDNSPSLDTTDESIVLDRYKPTLIAGAWTQASMMVQANGISSGEYNFGFDNIVNNNDDGTLRITNIMIVDLTYSFGAGNEPTLIWCNRNIILDADGSPYIKTKDSGNEYVSNNTNHINFIMRQRSKKIKVKIQSLDHNDNVLGEVRGYCTSGGVEISNSEMVRRSLSMQFVANEKLEISKNSPFWINKRLKILTGVQDYNNNLYWFNHGIYVPTQPDTDVSLSGRTISLAALDKMVLSDNPVLDTKRIPMGTPIAEAIRGLGEQYGETKFMMTNTDYSLPYDYEMSAGDSIQEAMKEITNLYMNYDTYYNVDGVLVFEKQQNRINDAPVWVFENENDFSISRKISADYTKVFNDYKVFGYYNDETAYQPIYQITITDDNHPFSVNNMKRKHSLVVSEDNYVTVAQCKERCEYELQQAENLINNFSITTAPIYSISDVNKVIKVSDNGKLYTCLIDSISYPLDISSPMSISCHEIFV